MRANYGLNSAFVSAVQRKRAQAEVDAVIADARRRAAEIVEAAKKDAEAIVDAGHEEVRSLIRGAKESADEPRRPVTEIVAEVAREHDVAIGLMFGKGGIARVRVARREAMRRAVAERVDLGSSSIARLLNVNPTTVSAEVRRQREARHG